MNFFKSMHGNWDIWSCNTILHQLFKKLEQNKTTWDELVADECYKWRLVLSRIAACSRIFNHSLYLFSEDGGGWKGGGLCCALLFFLTWWAGGFSFAFDFCNMATKAACHVKYDDAFLLPLLLLN